MHPRILITGGAGFLGSHLADQLLAAGAEVRVLDALLQQVHGSETQRRPEGLDAAVDLHVGDVRDRALVDRALQGIDAVVHFVAVIGIGQSLYESSVYTDVNCRGTAVLCEQAVRNGVSKLVVASSMSIYGEGAYTDAAGAPVAFEGRDAAQLAEQLWEPVDAQGAPLLPVPTTEDQPLRPASVYALTKLYQERICLNLGAAYKLPTVALRFFNVYGPRLSLTNPHAGALARFAVRLLRGQAPELYEDGQQSRDFVHVHDAARACALALDGSAADGQVLNVGSGQRRTVGEAAQALAQAFGREDLRPLLVGKSRIGDVRHCFADIGRAERLLGWQPQVSFEAGIAELATWLEGRVPSEAAPALQRRGLPV